MKVKPAYIFSVLCLSFIVYTAGIYLIPILDNARKSVNTATASHGKLIWQKYNCQSCHQLYGLGGYLGPDLTNIYSAKGKGQVFIRALIKSGTQQMPSFHLSPQEQEALLQFLKSVDASGSADPRNYVIKSTGMIEHR